MLRINGGKFNKDRVVPLTWLACSFLETYLKAIRPALLQGGVSDRVFISQRAAPLSKNALGELVEKYARIAEVNKHVTCHIWRHSCTMHPVKNKANLRHGQELLGHRDLSTTERYLHLIIADLKEAHRQCHPREQGVES
ncbi:MAG: tyrosine-type recombinase/integrase [Verrucomicrobiota bacterium]